MRYWLINALCGLLVLVLLGIHIATVYLDDLTAAIFGTDTDPLAWVQVSSRAESGLLTMTYVVFLGVALFHGFYGLHTMLTEFRPGRRAYRHLLVVCWTAGIILFLSGSIATVSFYFQNQVP